MSQLTATGERDRHDLRLAKIIGEFDHAMARFLGRLEQSGATGQTVRAPGEWSASQIAWHVALVNEAFAGIISGDVAATAPAPAGFVERAWQEIRSGIPERIRASAQVQPPAEAPMTESLARLRASAEKLRTAVAALSPERGSGFTLNSPIVGEISVYQIAEWATAHVIRHNAQAKRVLGR